MFDISEVGRRITHLRKEKNMTQMELADKMGISFQAVSNWERGYSMPDISKLPELAELFETSIDYLLGGSNEKYYKIVNSIIQEEKGNSVFENEKFESDEIDGVVPLLKPEQAKKLYESVPDIYSLDDLQVAAQYADAELLDKMALKHIEKDPFITERGMLRAARYLSKETVNRLALCLTACTNNFHIYNFADLIDDATLEAIIRREMDKRSYISGASLNKTARRLGANFAAELAEYVGKNQNLVDLSVLAPLLIREYLDNIVSAHIDRDPAVTERGVKALEGYVSPRILERLRICCSASENKRRGSYNGWDNYNTDKWEDLGRKIEEKISSQNWEEIGKRIEQKLSAFLPITNDFGKAVSKENGAKHGYLYEFTMGRITDDAALIEKIAHAITAKGKISDIKELSPYAERAVMDKIVLSCIDKKLRVNIKEVGEISDLISRDVIVKLTLYATNIDG